MATSIVLGYLPPLKDLPQNWGKRTIFTFDALGLDVSWEFNPSRIGRNNPRTLCSICSTVDTNNFYQFVLHFIKTKSVHKNPLHISDSPK